jgi:hypothetical protein
VVTPFFIRINGQGEIGAIYNGYYPNREKQLLYPSPYTGKELVDALIAARLTGKDYCYIFYWGSFDGKKLAMAIAPTNTLTIHGDEWDRLPNWVQRAWDYKEVNVEEVLDECW